MELSEMDLYLIKLEKENPKEYAKMMAKRISEASKKVKKDPKK